jgi:hypothetical protein
MAIARTGGGTRRIVPTGVLGNTVLVLVIATRQGEPNQSETECFSRRIT